MYSLRVTDAEFMVQEPPDPQELEFIKQSVPAVESYTCALALYVCIYIRVLYSGSLLPIPYTSK